MDPHDSDGYEPDRPKQTVEIRVSQSRWPKIFRFALLFVAGTVAAMLVAVRQDASLQAAVSERVLQWERESEVDLSVIRSIIGVTISPTAAGLIEAIENGDLLDASTLLNAGVDPNSESLDGVSALRHAVKKASIEGINLLIARGADIDLVDSSGRTPLIEAIDQDQTETAVQLIVLGADVNRAGALGNAPLHFAADRENLPLIEVLADRSAEIDIEDVAGRTPLMRASSKANAPVISQLLLRGADVNAQDRGGKTALMYAVETDDIAAVSALLVATVDLTLADNHGKRAKDYATERGGKIGALFHRVFNDDPRNNEPASTDANEESISAENKEIQPATKKLDPAREPTSNSEPSDEEQSEDEKVELERPAAKKMTRLRLVGKIEGRWEKSKQLQLRGVRLKVRNVGDYTAEDILIRVRVPGGEMLTLSGPTSLGRNAVAEYSTSASVSVSQGGNLKEEIACDNCYR